MVSWTHTDYQLRKYIFTAIGLQSYIYIFKKYTIESPTRRFNGFSRFRRAHGRGLNRREDMDTSCTKQSQHARVSDQTFLASELQMCGTICEYGWEYRSWAYVVLPKSPTQKRHSCGGPENHLNYMVPWILSSPHSKQHFDWFSRFGLARGIDQQTGTQTCILAFTICRQMAHN